MVQQLAGCYWRLAKVWTYETEAAWRNWIEYSMPLEEMKEYRGLQRCHHGARDCDGDR